MRYLHLLWANLMRRKLRTAFTVASIFVAFVLFCYLGAVDQAFELGVELAGEDRLVVRNKISLTQPLPEKYEDEMEEIGGVVDATFASWFGGVYQNPRQIFPQFPVKPEEYLAMFPEFELSEEERRRWLETKTGAVVGESLAEQYGWEVGDKVPIQATIWRPKTGGDTWEFDIVGIYEGAEKGTDTSQFLFRHDYFDENRRFGEGLVGWYYVKIADADRATATARDIDREFSNSPFETKTEPEGAFVQAFANQIGNIGAILTAVMTAVFFTILLVAGNTMAQAVRERTDELGVLKAVGFTSRQVLALTLAESLAIAVLGGGAGLLVGWALITSGGDPTGGFLPVFFVPTEDLLFGGLCVLALGLAAGLLPALQAMRLDTVTALRRAA